MKEELPAFFSVENTSRRRIVDFPNFLNYLTQQAARDFPQKHAKNIEEHLIILAKSSEDHPHVLEVVRFLCLHFKTAKTLPALQLIRAAIGSDLKFEASSQRENNRPQQDLRMADNNEVIALPYGPAPAPVSASAPIALRSEPMSDVIDQRKRGDSKNYYQEDNDRVAAYLDKQFKVVKRENISSVFGEAAQIICSELFQSFVEQFVKLPLGVLVELLKLLDYISAPLFTFYLIHRMQIIWEKIVLVLQQKETEKRASTTDMEGLIFVFLTINQRWYESDRKRVDFTLLTICNRIISLLITSPVSQKKLFAVKTLSDLCKSCDDHTGSVNRQFLETFIKEKGLLGEIYRADNHPEVIIKGENVFLFLVQDGRLNEGLINVIFNLLDKCHQHLSKSLFSTLQRVGHINIENHHSYLLKKIEELPRATCFNEETFILIESIMVSTPSSEVEASLETLYRIMEKNYDKLKEGLKTKAMVIYFQVFIMGIEQGIFDHSNAMLTLKPILHNPNSSLFPFMIENFIFRLKDQYSKQIGVKCKKTLHEGIRKLIAEEQIHKLVISDQKKHLRILHLLLQNYEELDQKLMSSEDLWVLIKMDRQFSKFIKFYPQDVQAALVSHLIATQSKSPYDIECIIDLYQLMNAQVKAALAPLLFEDYFKTHNLVSKYLLARHILEIRPITFEEASLKLQQRSQNVDQALSWIILIRQIIHQQDEKGFGKHPPFEDMKTSYQVSVKVSNCQDVMEPVQYEIKAKSFHNLYEITMQALSGAEVDFSHLKLKLNSQGVTLNQLKQKISNLTSYRNVTLEIDQTEQCQWFSKEILFNRDGMFKNEIIDILKTIFNTYASRDGKLRAYAIAHIFQRATRLAPILQTDYRIQHIFNNYSNNGSYIVVDEWINYFYQSSLKAAPLVIDNLKNLGFGHMLKTEENFKIMFDEENVLRNFINNDGKIYHILFKTYQQLKSNSPKEIHNDIVKEYTAALKLLPVSSEIIAKIQAADSGLLDYSYQNTLYYWYVSNLLQSVYFQNISISNHAVWKNAFENSEVFQKSLCAYEKYLYQIISEGPAHYKVNIDLEIFILESLGKVLRSKFSDIPSLVSQSVQFTPLSLSKSACVHINKPFLANFPQLGELCTNVCKGKRDQQIAENAIAIVLDIARSEGSVSEIKVIEELIFSDILSVRQIFNLFYYLLSSIHPQIKTQYYSIHITKNSKATYRHCQEYFFILNKFLFTEEDDRYYQEISKVYQKEISEERYIENLEGNTQTDQILLGKLKILNQIKLYNPQTQISPTAISSIKELLENSLSEQVREILYSMTNNICDIEYSLKLMIKIMEQTNLKRNSVHRGKKKMGILNLGCICYINSVLQQLEMIEPFRRGIIATEVVSDVIDFFREFQHIIYQLTFGQRIFLIPQAFCLNYLDQNNQPVNIKEQHDADEFLNQLFDKLEHRLKDTNQHHLINLNFKGQLVNVINCQKCYHKKEKIENFYILTVQIKNQSNLKDCLNKLIEPEIICDYFCEFCQGKVETIQKYNRFHSLPPFLFIHLQRLVFDLETFTKIKLDHPVSFPTEINLQDFFNQQVDPQIYVLKGFVVHVGNSEGGHYYSIIKCENGWIKFDDTRIDDWEWSKESHDRDNAYLLIYERKTERQIVSQEIVIGNPDIMKIVQNDINFLMKEKIFLQSSFTKYLLNTLKNIKIPEQFISNPNEAGNPYQSNFNDLPKEIQDQLDLAYEAIILYIKLQSEMRQIRISQNSSFMSENQNALSKDEAQLQSIVYYLICILHIRPKLAFNAVEYFIRDGPNNFLFNIYLHRQKVIRYAFKIILNKIIVVLAASLDKNISFLVPIPQSEVINKLLQKIMLGLNEVGKNPTKMVEYFQLLYEVCKLDNRFVQWFQANKLGPKLIHFYMQKQSGLENLLPVYPYYATIDRKVETISLVIEIINELLNYEPDLSVEREDNLLERKAYLNIDFYRKLLSDRYDNQNIHNLFKYAARNERINEKILNLVVQNLNRFNHEDEYIYNYIHIMYGLLTLKDDYSKRRIERLFGVPILVSIGQNDADKYEAKTQTDRVCKYWNPCLKPGDEIIFSFLQLLYSNRHQHNYFTLLGIICLLKLITTNQDVNRYVARLPGPCLGSKSYTEWINDFVYNFERTQKEDNNSRISNSQKHNILQEIVKYLRDLQINQEKVVEREGQAYHGQLSIIKQLYHIGLIKNYSEWQQVQFEYFDNLLIFNYQNVEQISNVSANQLVSIRYRILYCADEEQGQDCARVIQYEIDIKQKAKLYFTEFYDYAFTFDSGYYELALPFHPNQIVAMRIQLLEEVNYKPKENKQEQMIVEPGGKEANDQYISSRNNEDFPTISDFYDKNYATNSGQDWSSNQGIIPPPNWNNGEGVKQENEVEIECPFCGFKANSFSSKCPGCGQEWGQMRW